MQVLDVIPSRVRVNSEREKWRYVNYKSQNRGREAGPQLVVEVAFEEMKS
jgi:hypothetical protein